MVRAPGRLCLLMDCDGGHIRRHATPRARRGGREWRRERNVRRRIERCACLSQAAQRARGRQRGRGAPGPCWSRPAPICSLAREQMTPADNGSATAWPAARQAAIGASTCIAKASRTRG